MIVAFSKTLTGKSVLKSKTAFYHLRAGVLSNVFGYCLLLLIKKQENLDPQTESKNNLQIFACTLMGVPNAGTSQIIVVF